MNMETQSLQITISGRVQNVGFRYATHEKAQQLGIKGFVKNLMNGNVYIEAEADENLLNEFVLWCQAGPPWAKVFDVKIMEQPFMNFTIFEIKR